MQIFQYINSLTIIDSILCILPYLILWFLGCELLRKIDKVIVIRVVSMLLLFIWAYATLRYTTFGRTVRGREFSLIPFHQLYMYIRYDAVSLMMSAWFNVLLFLPLGVLIPEILSDKWSGKKFLIVLVCGMVMSFGIELAQAIWGLGLVETDDVICNTLGACLGYGVYYSCNKGK